MKNRFLGISVLLLIIGMILTCSNPTTPNECPPSSKALACCVKTSNVDTPDHPNSPVDSNCDGIDGNQSQAAFVDGFSGLDQNDCSKEHPCKTINFGITQAAALGKRDVYVSTGVYQETVILKNGISVYGGFSATDDWNRNPAYLVSIQNPVSVGPSIAVKGDGLFAQTVLADVHIQSADAITLGQSSYGIHCINCPSLTVLRSRIAASAGAHGQNGQDGKNGEKGKDATNIDEVSGDFYDSPWFGGTSTIGRAGGNGGNGGGTGRKLEPGGNGFPGNIGSPGGLGGPPLTLSSAGQPGAPGGNGTPGTSGDSGRQGEGGKTQDLQAIDNVSVNFYWISQAGEPGGNGTPGNGGGGGGGGGPTQVGGDTRTFQFGCRGGGGGAGGQGALGANPGMGGGGSFGLFLIQSDGVTLQDTVVFSSSGGGGGNGSRGGVGGPGGVRGEGQKRMNRFCGGGDGGFGGNGGDGGDGGHSGGGAGGPSFSIWRYRSQIHFAGKNLLFFGIPGEGGPAPLYQGQTGLSGQINPN